MPTSKFLLTIMGILATIFAILNFNAPVVNEGFWGIQKRSFKAIPVMKTKSGNVVAAGGNFLGPLSDDRFVKTPSFQSLMSPRFNSLSNTPYIRYNPTDMKNQASVPCDPLMTKSMVEENYNPDVQESFCGGNCGGNGCSANCGKGGTGLSVPSKYSNIQEPGYSAGDYNKVHQQVVSDSQYPEATDMLPLGTMTNIDAEGNQTNPVVYQNFIFANQKSRLRCQGDPIRGDLAIVPCEGNWFSVHPNVNLDLHEGAMNVLGGNTNSTAQATAQLITAAAGVVQPIAGDPNPFAGTSMTPSYEGEFSALGRDIQISGMP